MVSAALGLLDEPPRSVPTVLSTRVDGKPYCRPRIAPCSRAAVEAVDEAAAAANELGFFVSGVILHGVDGHDHLRLQLLDSTEIELDDVVCDSPFAKALMGSVLEDKSRVGV